MSCRIQVGYSTIAASEMHQLMEKGCMVFVYPHGHPHSETGLIDLYVRKSPDVPRELASDE